MPCNPRFHTKYIEKWLAMEILGSCPFCMYKIPVDREARGGQEEG